MCFPFFAVIFKNAKESIASLVIRLVPDALLDFSVQLAVHEHGRNSRAHARRFLPISKISARRSTQGMLVSFSETEFYFRLAGMSSFFIG